MKHLTADQLSRLLDGDPDDRALEGARRHLEQCATCREELASLGAQDDALQTTLLHDPGEAYFESFAERVGARIARGAQSAAPARRPGGWREWLASPRRLAWAGGLAALVVGAGIVFLSVRDAGLRDLRRPELMQRSDQVAEPPAGQAAGPAAKEREAGPPGEVAPDRDRAGVAPVPGAEQPSPRASNEELGATAPAPQAAREAEQPSLPPRSEARSEAEPPADGATGRAAPSRASRVRRDNRGEDVPVRGEDLSKFARPPARAADDESGQPPKPGPQPLAPQTVTPRTTELEKARQKLAPATPAPEGAEQKTAASSLTQGERAAGGAAESFRSLRPETLQDRAAARLCGTVRDRSGRPVAGAQVAVADRGLTATTDPAGRFCVTAPPGDHTLSVMAVGFETVRREVRVGAASGETEVTLDPVAVLEGPGIARPRGLLLDRSLSDLSTWPAAARGAARQAERKSEQAAASRSADQFDGAAELWSRALAQVRGGAHEVEARARLAETRYRAWEIAPTPRRRSEAIEALTSYLVRAPGGSPRDSAARRLDRVKR